MNEIEDDICDKFFDDDDNYTTKFIKDYSDTFSPEIFESFNTGLDYE